MSRHEAPVRTGPGVAKQVLHGHPLGPAKERPEATCDGSGDDIKEGRLVTVDAERDRSAEEWTVTGVYLAGEAPGFESAPGVETARVAGWAAVRCLPAAGTRRYTLAEPQVERYEEP